MYSIWAGIWTSLGAWIVVSAIYVAGSGWSKFSWLFIVLPLIGGFLVQFYPGWSVSDMGGSSKGDKRPEMLEKMVLVGWLLLILLAVFHLSVVGLARTWWMNNTEWIFWISLAILLTKAVTMPSLLRMPTFVAERYRRIADEDRYHRHAQQVRYEQAQRGRGY